MSWGKFEADDLEYDLSHLDPFTMKVEPKDGSAQYHVLVTFGHHAFTRELKDEDPPDYHFTVDADTRCFCKHRHEYSCNLPAIIESSANGKAYFSQGRNFLLIEDLPGVVGPYAVFFNVEKAKAKGLDASLFVVSAYPKPNMPPKKSLLAVTMPTLIGKTVRGEKVTRPPPKAKK